MSEEISDTQETLKKPLSSLDDIQRSWYSKELREALFKEAWYTVTRFLLKKDLDLFVPTCAVVPVYHVRHYQAVYKRLQEQYNPEFIMTLPMRHADKQYTVLFPVSDKIPRT